MRWSNPSPVDPAVRLIRPLLDLSRTDLLAYARQHRLRFREDASNQSLDYQRNKIRHQLLPLMTQEFQKKMDKEMQAARQILEGQSRQLSMEIAEKVLGRRV